MANEKFAVFLRGVNVGGNAAVNMDVLKKALTGSGLTDVKSYINSGNLTVSSGLDKTALEQLIQQVISSHFGLSVRMIIKTKEELDHLLKQDPFDPEKEKENSKRIVVLLSGAIDGAQLDSLTEQIKADENYYYTGDLLYIYFHHGSGTSKFNSVLIEKKFKVTTTGRNWNTLLKMADLLNS